ncbi:calcium-binding protein [Nostoc linckia]|uniref:calcium-binding protein n=1 Tax=Nostoc linckia TaxID=92942 RepID=UPI000BFFC7AF|nr:calcium-binding protein [Nostoc linckia]
MANLWIIGGSGNDSLVGGSDGDRLDGLDGNDILRGGNGDDNNLFRYFPAVDEFANGGLYGGNGNDQLFGEVGNDWLFGEADNDTLNGGDGDDYLNGGTGINSIIGGAGNDAIALDFSAATTGITINYTVTTNGTVSNGSTFREIESVGIKTGSGNDNIVVSATTLSNLIRTSVGNDTIISGAGSDRLEGGDGNDILRGGNGDDNNLFQKFAGADEFANGGLYGGNGNDQLFGEVGNDWLFGEADNDTLNGGDGDDYLNGGNGNDTLTGGAGTDRFVFDTGLAFTTNFIGSDRITDFISSTDKIVLDKTTFTALISNAGANINSSEFAVINEAVNGGSLAGTSVAKIVFNRFNGDLFYNQDGTTAGLGSGGLFATLAGVSSLTTNDLQIVA